LEEQKRPTGVTIIAILTIVGGILIFVLGISLTALWILTSVSPINISITTNTTNNNSTNDVTGSFIIFSAVVGCVFLAMGIGYLTIFYGLLKGKGWAWLLTMVLLIVGIIIQIVSITSGDVFNLSEINKDRFINRSTVSEITISVIGMVINMLIIYYLLRPHVRAYFGRLYS
jgi:hypothetical protein